MRILRCCLLITSLLLPLLPTFVSAADTASVRQTAVSSDQSSATAPSQPGWEGGCSVVADTLIGSLAGGAAGLVLAAIPALLLAFTRFRQVGFALAIGAVVAGALVVGGISFALKAGSCPEHPSASVVDAEINTDSLYRSWQRFAAATDPSEQRAIARAIHCEKIRIALIGPHGEAALRLVESRVATPAAFEELEERALRAYGSPMPGVIEMRPDDLDPAKCNKGTGTVVGRVVDEETGKPVWGFLMGVAGVGTFAARDSGRFVLEHLPALPDSQLVLICPTEYDLTTRRVLVRDGAVATLDISITKPKRGPNDFPTGAEMNAKLDRCRNAQNDHAR